jgi:hypothetical protein
MNRSEEIEPLLVNYNSKMSEDPSSRKSLIKDITLNTDHADMEN